MPRRTDTGRAQHGALRPILIIGPRQGSRRRIALVAHDNKKRDLLDWARFNRDGLAQHQLLRHRNNRRDDPIRTGPGGHSVQQRPARRRPATRRQDHRRRHRPGALLLGPLKPQPHDPDERALLRIAVVWNIPIACNRATADYLISSPLLDSDYHPLQPDYGTVQPPCLSGSLHRLERRHVATLSRTGRCDWPCLFGDVGDPLGFRPRRLLVTRSGSRR